ncbi:MAG TPA: HEAT repeat domain-containing protein [Alphaproteobacteria bacterium]|nr:HEAT repeat domain-containing protein [Alphaproteobacteria bacterium]
MKPYWIGLLALLVWVASVGSGGASGIDALIQDLRTGDETTRIRAVVALGDSADPKAVGALQEALHDESRLVRQYALHALKDLLQILERTSRLVTRWLHDLVDRLEQQLEEPQTTAAKHPF